MTHDTDTGSAFNPLYTTTFTLTGTGQVSGATVNDGIPKTMIYVLDGAGQIIRHDEVRSSAPGQAAPHEMFYRFGGKQVELTGNNGTDDLSYAKSIDDRARPTVDVTSSNAGLFRDGTQYGATGYADFSMSLENFNSAARGGSGGTYTVRTGDTLAGIALAVWGDAGLWYRLAEANGISGDAALAEGRQLVLPAGVVNNEHNAGTLKPYNPLDAMGNVSPTTPKPPKQPNCVLMLVVAVIAIAMAVWGLR